jgi:hypothetical protein
MRRPCTVNLSGIHNSSDRAVVHPDGGSDAVQWIAVVVGDDDRLHRLHRLPGHLGGHQLGGELRGRACRVAVRDHSRANRVRGRGYHALRSRGGAACGRASCCGLIRGGGRISHPTCGFVTNRDQGGSGYRDRDIDDRGRTAANVVGIPAISARSRSATKLRTNAPTASAAVAVTATRYTAPEAFAFARTAMPWTPHRRTVGGTAATAAATHRDPAGAISSSWVMLPARLTSVVPASQAQ